MSTRVAVIGAGPLGLMAMKNLREDGFDVTGFEKRSYVGGLWKPSQDSTLSVTEMTVFNSSRFRSAVTDYPFPDDADDFPTAKQIHKYFESYCDRFNLRPIIRLNAEVRDFKRAEGKWALEISHHGSPSQVEYFDKILVASGSFATPRTPKLNGIDQFQGTSLHSLSFPHPSQFKGQNVMLIGLHATTQDLVVELSEHAKKVYIAHKSGVVMVSEILSLPRQLSKEHPRTKHFENV